MSLLVVNGGAIYATATTTATPIKFEEPPTELVIGQPFTLQLAVQGSQEHQVMVAIPEALTVDQTKTRQANRASLAELDFDADNRKLTLTPSDQTASTTFDLVLSASEAKTYKVTAEALITGPALATTTASAVASSEKPTTHTMTAEPITFTVAAGSAVDSPPEEAGTESAREVSNDAESTSSASQDPTTDDSRQQQQHKRLPRNVMTTMPQANRPNSRLVPPRHRTRLLTTTLLLVAQRRLIRK